MSIADITAALWRRRLLFAITLIACLGVVALVTAAVPRIYRATATIYVGTDQPKLGSDQGEQLARTYTTLAANPNVAQDAIAALHIGLTRQQLLDKMSFTPIERTQLLEIGAEDKSPTQAQRIANTYASVFAADVAVQRTQGLAPASVAVNQTAVVPTSPVRPKPALYLAFGALLSILVAGAVVVVRDRLDRRLRIGPRDDAVLGQTILARIPTLQPGRSEVKGKVDAARIVRSDAFRVLRTNLDRVPGGPARTIMVTSPGAGEGKTTIAAQLALTVATDREHVAVVECDLRRRPRDGGGFGADIQRTAKGLAEYLDDAATYRQIVKPAPSIPDLTVVWSGQPVPEPGPLLHSERLPQLIEHLSAENDWVIIDTPPIAVGDDALVVSSWADGTVVVVDAEETTGPALEFGLNQLRQVRAPVLGVVVNHAPPAELDAYRYLTEEAEPARGARKSRSS
ncbi:MAG: tyrosine-protein kinase [Solirubrobacterales bacterium]|jgi:capsular exopolysaccharide synthesis family protein|nr:tyrosine-protein kinase [Solirubrobacterales bacterium]